MAGIIAVYSLVIAVLLASDIGPPPDTGYSPFKYVLSEQCKQVPEAHNFTADSCIWLQGFRLG